MAAFGGVGTTSHTLDSETCVGGALDDDIFWPFVMRGSGNIVSAPTPTFTLSIQRRCVSSLVSALYFYTNALKTSLSRSIELPLRMGACYGRVIDLNDAQSRPSATQGTLGVPR